MQRASLEDALRQLYFIGCLDEDGKILPMGRRLAKLPLDPSLGRVLAAAAESGCLEDALTISAMLSAESVFAGNRSTPPPLSCAVMQLAFAHNTASVVKFPTVDH